VAFKWYNPENVIIALVGRRGLEIIQEEVEMYEDLFGEGHVYLIPLKGVTTEPPPGYPVFKGDCVALVRRAAGGSWNVPGRMPAGLVPQGMTCVSHHLLFEVLYPWDGMITTARQVGLDPRTGALIKAQTTRLAAGELPLLGAYAYLCLTPDAAVPGLNGTWAIARHLGQETEALTRWQVRRAGGNEVELFAIDSMRVDLGTDVPGYQEVLAARFNDRTKDVEGSLRRLKSVVGLAAYARNKPSAEDDEQTSPKGPARRETYNGYKVGDIVLCRHPKDGDKPKGEQRWVLSKAYYIGADSEPDVGGDTVGTDWPNTREWDSTEVFVEEIAPEHQAAAKDEYFKMTQMPHDDSRCLTKQRWKAKIVASANLRKRWANHHARYKKKSK
jgi:hypothetical protein